MPYRRIPGHDRTSPLKYWLREHLPPERPEDVNPQTWAMLGTYLAGASLKDLAAQEGISAQALSAQFRKLARTLGYHAPEVQRWLLPDGTVAPHMIAVDPDTGCWLWRGSFRDDQLGPFAVLLESLRPPGITAVQPRQPVRRILWERQHGQLPSNKVLIASCGRRACVNPEHGILRGWIEGRSASYRDDLLQRKNDATLGEAADRLGVSVSTIIAVRGAGGKKVETSKLRPWLKDHLPAQQPASVIEQDWRFARRYVEGVSLATISAEAGVSRQMVHMRIKRLAMTLGWTEPEKGDG